MLVFVVPARRQVVVLADEGALARIDRAVWHEIAARIAAAFARGDGTSGLVDGIARLGHALAGPFPHRRDDIDELPDQPVTVEVAPHADR